MDPNTSDYVGLALTLAAVAMLYVWAYGVQSRRRR